MIIFLAMWTFMVILIIVVGGMFFVLGSAWWEETRDRREGWDEY